MGRSGSRISSIHRPPFPGGSVRPGSARIALAMLNVLVTMPFSELQLDRMRRVSPSLTVTREDPQRADYARADVLYAGMPPRDLDQAGRLKWVQLHMAGVNALYDHPLYTDSAITLTTT